jgi:hypothetical protein
LVLDGTEYRTVHAPPPFTDTTPVVEFTEQTDADERVEKVAADALSEFVYRVGVRVSPRKYVAVFESG